MTRLLAIDTSTDACSVALLSANGVQQQIVIAAREHTQRLLPMVESLLADTGMSLSQCDGIAFGVGPGSFTGLRIGISAAQGLAYGADLPLLPVSTLKAMAQTAVRKGYSDEVIVPVIDARMDEVYAGFYQPNQETGLVDNLSDEMILSPEDLAGHQLLKQFSYTGVGSGWRYDLLSSVAKTQAVEAFYPEAHDIALLAQVDMAKGLAVNPLEITPTYLRNEVSWTKRKRIRQPQ